MWEAAQERNLCPDDSLGSYALEQNAMTGDVCRRSDGLGNWKPLVGCEQNGVGVYATYSVPPLSILPTVTPPHGPTPCSLETLHPISRTMLRKHPAQPWLYWPASAKADHATATHQWLAVPFTLPQARHDSECPPGCRGCDRSCPVSAPRIYYYPAHASSAVRA